MVTTVGTSSDVTKLIENFILLERDAIAAYDASIERLENPDWKARVAEFREDHVRHLKGLQQMAARHGAPAPAEGDAKQMLTTGKIKMANLAGDGAILKAMSTNESDTVSAYSSACGNDAIPPEDKALFEQGRADEERHKDWMDSVA